MYKENNYISNFKNENIFICEAIRKVVETFNKENISTENWSVREIPLWEDNYGVISLTQNEENFVDVYVDYKEQDIKKIEVKAMYTIADDNGNYRDVIDNSFKGAIEKYNKKCSH